MYQGRPLAFAHPDLGVILGHTCYGRILSDFHSRLMQRRDVLELLAVGVGTNRLFKS
jgi:hypothetical protein